MFISLNIQKICEIWAKEVRNTFRDEGMVIFFIVVPLLYPLLYSWIYNNQTVREVPVAAVDLSHSELSREFLRNYNASPDVNVAYYCNSLDEAKALVGKQVVNGVVYIPSDFATRVHRMQQSTLSLYCDMSMMLNYKALYQAATEVIGKMNGDIQISLSGNYTEREDQLTTQPLDFDEVPIFNSTGGYGDFIIPGVLILILQQTLLLGIGLSAGTAREHLDEHTTENKNPLDSILGKGLCYLMIYAILSAWMLLVVPRLFGFISIVHLSDLLGLLVPYLLAVIFFGLMLSCLVRYRENVLLLVVFTSVPLLFLSGVSWPQYSMPGAWRAVACLFPSTFGIRGFVRLNSMGATLQDIQVEYIALWCQAAIFLLITYLIHRYSNKNL